MTRWAVLTFAIAFTVIGCAHPERIKTISKEQEALLVRFKGALEDVRVRLRLAFDESIDEYRGARLRVFLNSESSLLSARIAECIRNPDATCEHKGGRVRLNEASQYLATAQATLFTARFCATDGTWATAKKAWMRREGEACPKEPHEVVQRLERGRDVLDGKFKDLGQEIAAVQEGHAIIDKFLQIRIEIRAEDVDAARQAIEKATRAMADARAAMDAVAKEK